ncbi:MAG: DUF1491 family protein [Alphaproteobacteria bacterium]|nr:DUF1491 family protein [Alphaproteobacteria bacterium]
MYERDRLRTDLWLSSHLRRCSDQGVPATVVHRGEAQSGTVVLKLNLAGQGCRVLTQSRGLDGEMGWLPALEGKLVDEAEADAYVERTIGRDPDIWVVEIEHRDGWHPFEGEIF